MQIKPYDEIKVSDVVNVTGLSVYNYSSLASKLEKGFIVSLRHDPINKYDKNATGVYFEGDQIGWIPKSSNSDFAKHILNKEFVNAIIVKHDRNYSDISKRLFIQILPEELKRLSSITNCAAVKRDGGWAVSSNYGISIDTSLGIKLQELLKQQPINEENKMNKLVNDTITRNSNNATSAAFLEAGRIANRQATKLAAKHLPMIVRGYADTAGGRLVLANIAATAAAQFRPGDKRLARLADAMMVTSYQEVLQSFDIEKMIEDMLSNETIKAALNKVSENDDAGL